MDRNDTIVPSSSGNASAVHETASGERPVGDTEATLAPGVESAGTIVLPTEPAAPAEPKDQPEPADATDPQYRSTVPIDRRAAARWLVSAVLVIAMHGAIATLLLPWQEPAGASQPADPIMIELAPVAPAPTSVPQAESQSAPEQIQAAPDKIAENVPDQPVDEPIPEKSEPEEPQPTQANEDKPEQPEDMKPAEQQAPVIVETEQKSDVELPRKRAEAQKRTEKKSESKSAAPHEAPREAKAERPRPSAAAPSQPSRMAAAAPSGSPGGGPSLSNWKSEVIGILERNKHYPAGAGVAQGVAHLAFTLNRQGRVTSARIAGSSGSAPLDAETLSLIHRVAFPPPPADMPGAQISLVVALRYNVR